MLIYKILDWIQNSSPLGAKMERYPEEMKLKKREGRKKKGKRKKTKNLQ